MAGPAAKNFEQADDYTLLQQISAGQQEAFAAMYDRYSARLYGLALKILARPALAEEAVQDVFLTLWKKAATLKAREGSLIGWLMVLCRNRCIDQLRSQARREAKSDSLSEARDLPSLDAASDPFELTRRSDLQGQIKQALAQLPDLQRDLIEMAYFQGYSQSQLADHFNLPLGTVKTRIRLGMEKLRNVIKLGMTA